MTGHHGDDPAALFAAGVAEFDAGRFWDAHERWEQIWLPATGDRRTFLQGLIQLAAAYYHLERGNLRGSTRLFDRATERLSATRALWPPLRLDEALERAARDRSDAAAALARGEPLAFEPASLPRLDPRR